MTCFAIDSNYTPCVRRSINASLAIGIVVFVVLVILAELVKTQVLPIPGSYVPLGLCLAGVVTLLTGLSIAFILDRGWLS